MMAGSVSSAASWAERPSSASPTMSKSGSRSRIARMPTRTRAWSSTSRIRIRSSVAAPVGATPPAVRPGIGHALPPLSRTGTSSTTTVPFAGRDRTVKCSANQLGPLAHELQPEGAPPGGGGGVGIEAATVVADLQDPAASVAPGGEPDVARAGVLADVLERLLEDAQDHHLLGVAELVGRRRQVDLHRGPGQRVERGGRVADRPVQADLVEDRRPQLADERAHVAQLAAQPLAQEAELDARGGPVVVEDLLDVLHAEDRVGQRLRRPVVDLLGEARPLGLARLHDPHLEVVGELRRRRVGEERGVPALEEEPGALQAAHGQLQARQLGLALAQLGRLERDPAAQLRRSALLGGRFRRLHAGDRAGPRRVLRAAHVRAGAAGLRDRRGPAGRRGPGRRDPRASRPGPRGRPRGSARSRVRRVFAA